MGLVESTRKTCQTTSHRPYNVYQLWRCLRSWNDFFIVR